MRAATAATLSASSCLNMIVHCRRKFDNDYRNLLKIYTAMEIPPRIVIGIPPIKFSCTAFFNRFNRTSAQMCVSDVQCIIKCLLPQRIKKIAKELRLSEIVDLSKADIEMSGPKEYPDIHPNCQGHATMAETLQHAMFSREQVQQDKATRGKRTTSLTRRMANGWQSMEMEVPHAQKKSSPGIITPQLKTDDGLCRRARRWGDPAMPRPPA